MSFGRERYDFAANPFIIGDGMAGDVTLIFAAATDGHIVWDETSFDFGSANIVTAGNLTVMGLGTFGTYTGSRGGGSFVAGSGNEASGSYSVAMGQSSTASGYASAAMGRDTTASGYYSVAMGRDTIASGTYSVAMGEYSAASGSRSTAMGRSSTASGEDSTAMGSYTTAESYADVAFGRYNIGGGTAGSWVATDPLFELGIGADADNKANALTVYKNGRMLIATTTTVAAEALQIAQNDDDQAFIDYAGTSAGDTSKNISTLGIDQDSGAGTVAAPDHANWDCKGMVKIEIGGVAFWMAAYQPN